MHLLCCSASLEKAVCRIDSHCCFCQCVQDCNNVVTPVTTKAPGGGSNGGSSGGGASDNMDKFKQQL